MSLAWSSLVDRHIAAPRTPTRSAWRSSSAAASPPPDAPFLRAASGVIFGSRVLAPVTPPFSGRRLPNLLAFLSRRGPNQPPREGNASTEYRQYLDGLARLQRRL